MNGVGTAAGAVCPYAGIECLTEPGPDGIVGTGDDAIVSLENYTRTITITPVVTQTIQDVLRSSPDDEYVRSRCSQFLEEAKLPVVY